MAWTSRFQFFILLYIFENILLTWIEIENSWISIKWTPLFALIGMKYLSSRWRGIYTPIYKEVVCLT